MQYAIFFNALPPYPGAYAPRERVRVRGFWCRQPSNSRIVENGEPLCYLDLRGMAHA